MMENKRMYARDDDLISRLPQPILHHILSFMLADDAARMAVLSQTWLQVWNTLPFLDFFERCPGVENFEKSRLFLPSVDQILSNRMKTQFLSVIDKFSIDYGCESSRSFAPYLVCWIVILKELHICHLYLHDNNMYNSVKGYMTLCETIVSVKSIISLDLMGFNLDSLRGKVLTWPSLQKLHLSVVCLSDDLIHNIVTSCPEIEDLEFKYCSGFKDVTILSLVKLRNFKITTIERQNPKVDIHVPNLESFCYLNADTQNCFNIAGCIKLKTLRFSCTSITEDMFDNLFSLFPLLESLTFGYCKFLAKINISSGKLKYLNFKQCVELVELNIDTPNLSTLIYSGHGALLLSLKNVSPLVQVDVELTEDISTDVVKCTKFINFLRIVGNFELVRLTCPFYKYLAISKDISNKLKLHPTECGLKKLLLKVWAPDLTLSAAMQTLDDLFWVYPRLESLCIVTASCRSRTESDSLEKLYERLSEEEVKAPHCCGSLPTKCWRHLLKEVLFETPRKDEVHKNPHCCTFDISKHKILRIKLKPREYMV